MNSDESGRPGNLRLKERASPHVLLSSMGAAGPKSTEYYFDNDSQKKVVKSGFSATALWQLLPERTRPDEIWFLLTPKAREAAWSGIEAEAKELGVSVRPIPLDGGRAANDTNVFLSETADSLPPGSRLTLDITQGLRHHAFLFFALALYVSRFQENTIEGIWYSRLETENKNDPKPIIDLKPVHALANWFLALSEFQDTGSLREMSKLVEDRRNQKLFAQLSQEFLTGLPVEAGITAARIKERLKKEDAPPLAGIPLEQQVRELILREIEPLAVSFDSGNKKFEKHDCRLTAEELTRQSNFISKYLEAGQDNLAFGFMREWTVNQVLEKENITTDWLKHKQRVRVEMQLGCLANLLNEKADPNRDNLSDALKEQAKNWDSLKELRNALQHNGMRPESVPKKVAKKLKDKWKKDQSGAVVPPVFGGSRGTLLICPLGNTAGVLYSALLQVKPDRCLIICSPQTKASIGEAISRAGWEGEHLKLVMQDVHRGVEEFAGLLAQAKVWLFEADEIEANLTGGTSLMGVFAGQLLEHAERTYRRPKRRFVLIDSRPYERQRDEPWVMGDIHYIDRESEQTGGEG